MVDTVSADVQQSNVSIHTSAPKMCALPAEYLRDMTPEPQRTDVLGDDTVHVRLGIHLKFGSR